MIAAETVGLEITGRRVLFLWTFGFAPEFPIRILGKDKCGTAAARELRAGLRVRRDGTEAGATAFDVDRLHTRKAIHDTSIAITR